MVTYGLQYKYKIIPHQVLSKLGKHTEMEEIKKLDLLLHHSL